MSLVLLFQLDLVSETNTASLSLVARIQVTTTATVSLDSRISAEALRTLELLAAVQKGGSSLLSLLAAVQAITNRTLTFDAAVTRIAFRSLGLLGKVTGFPQKYLSLLAHVATDVHSHTLGLAGLMSAESDVTLGLDANILASTVRRLFLAARVSREAEATLGLHGVASLGPVLHLAAFISRQGQPTLGIFCLISPPGHEPFYHFLPDDDRIYEDWGHSPPPEPVARFLTGAETQYLVIRYVNFPNPRAKADAAWIWDDTYLPVNGAEISLTEPAKEGIFETIAARTLVVSETEYATPRATRARKFEVTFKGVAIQFVKFTQMRLRTGTEFPMEILLFNVQDDQWEEAYTDPAESTYLTWYWGTLPAWKPGMTRVRLNGVVQPDDGSVYLNHYPEGAVEFLTPLTADDEVLVQYSYRPRVTVLSVNAKPIPGHSFNAYDVQVGLQEVGA